MFGVQSAALEDKSFTHYCTGNIIAECLTYKPTPSDFKQAEGEFGRAIDYALRAGNLGILVTHSRLQLARMYLSTTHTHVHPTADKDRIKKSSECLDDLMLTYDSLDQRCKSIFHLNQSDLYKSRSETELAVESAKLAQSIAESGDLPMEIEAAKIRIKMLSREQCYCIHL